MIDKIKLILQKFTEEDARSWEIGTNFFQSIIQFGKKISNIPNLNTYEFIEVRSTSPNRFKIFIGETDITPCMRVNTEVAESTIRQYLQEGSALRYFSYSNGDNVVGRFSINPRFFELASNNRENVLANRLFIFLVYSTKNPIYFNKNLFYSLFLCLLYRTNLNLFVQLEEHVVRPRTVCCTTRGVLPSALNSQDVQDYIQHIFGYNNQRFGNGKNTYIEAADKLLSRYSFERIVNCMNDYIVNPTYDLIDEIETTQIRLQQNHAILFEQAMAELRRRRGQFKTRVISNRGITDETIWSDLENSYSRRTNLLDACHIYDVANIKRDISDRITNRLGIKDLLEKVWDPSNCILMDTTAHRMFDRTEEIWFDIEGNLCFANESKQLVQDVFGSTTLRIKRDIFNDAMRNYIKQR